MKLALYSSRGTPLLKPALVFKVPKSTLLPDFFVKENIEQSPWDDLITENARVFRSGDDCWNRPAHCRLFRAMKVFEKGKSGKSCDDFIGWLMLTARNGEICPFEKRRGRQRVILYSKGKAAVRFNDDSESSIAFPTLSAFFFFCSFGQKISTSEGLLPEKMKLSNRKLKQATFLSHGGKPEVNTSHARKMVFPRFSN